MQGFTIKDCYQVTHLPGKGSPDSTYAATDLQLQTCCG